MEKKSLIQRLDLIEFVKIMVVSAIIALIINKWGYHMDIAPAIPGMCVLFVIAFTGVILSKLVPVKLPPVLYISIVAILAAMPASPVSELVIETTSAVNSNAFLTPTLCFTGILMAKNWKRFLEIGWRGVVITLLVILGTYLGSALIAELVLQIQGII